MRHSVIALTLASLIAASCGPARGDRANVRVDDFYALFDGSFLKDK